MACEQQTMCNGTTGDLEISGVDAEPVIGPRCGTVGIARTHESKKACRHV
jgi:hypothetical protein